MADTPKIKHGSSHMDGGLKVLSLEEQKALGLPMDPVFVISPVPFNEKPRAKNTKDAKKEKEK